MSLLHVAEGLNEKIAAETDKDILADLTKYRDALMVVAEYSAIHQKAVIDKFSELVKGDES